MPSLSKDAVTLAYEDSDASSRDVSEDKVQIDIKNLGVTPIKEIVNI